MQPMEVVSTVDSESVTSRTRCRPRKVPSTFFPSVLAAGMVGANARQLMCMNVHVPSHFPSQPVDGSRLLHYHHHQDQCQYGTSMSGNIWSGAAAVDPMIHKSTAALSGFWRTMSALGRWRICPTHLHPIFARRALFATISS